MKNLEYSIGPVLQMQAGESFSSEFSVLPEKGDFEGIEIKGEVSGKLTLMRIKNAILAQVENLSLKVLLPCQRCLDSFEYPVKIEELDGTYVEKINEMEDYTEDVFKIDMKNHRIDISELLRQEIILHFPVVSVCSKSCKGLCPVCGVDLNKENCSCDKEQGLKQLSILKELYNGKTSSTKKKDL